MNVFYSILTVVYVIFLVIVCAFIAWNTVRTKRLTEKIVGAIALIMFLLRIFFIK